MLDEIWEGEDMLYRYLSDEKNKNPSLRIFFTGHSLGGALALIAASRFPDADCVYTYGCPRAGNKAFADSIKARVYRTVNNNDVVTTLPSKKILFDKTGEEYTHKGMLKFIDEKGKIKDKILNKFASDKGHNDKENISDTWALRNFWCILERQEEWTFLIIPRFIMLQNSGMLIYLRNKQGWVFG